MSFLHPLTVGILQTVETSSTKKERFEALYIAFAKNTSLETSFAKEVPKEQRLNFNVEIFVMCICYVCCEMWLAVGDGVFQLNSLVQALTGSSSLVAYVK